MTEIMHYTDSIHYELEQNARLLKKLSLQLFNDLKISLSPDEYVTLDTILINKSICQRDLAKLILKDRANTGRILNSLESKGLIERCADTKNNRLVKKTSVTQKGETELENINHKLKTYMKGTIRKIAPDEVEKVKNVLKKFRLNLEKAVNINI